MPLIIPFLAVGNKKKKKKKKKSRVEQNYG